MRSDPGWGAKSLSHPEIFYSIFRDVRLVNGLVNRARQGRLLGGVGCSGSSDSLTVPPGGLRFRSQALRFREEPDYSGGSPVEACFGTPGRNRRDMLERNHTPLVKRVVNG